MPISRALLNRLRLPYKALDIQGSKGDVLYIPDDVGVDLSVIHGVHNGDMVPVKTDDNGIISVVIDNSGGGGKGKYQYQALKSIIATEVLQHVDIDTSQFVNYMFAVVVNNSTDITATLTVNYNLVINNVDITLLNGITVLGVVASSALASIISTQLEICGYVTRVFFNIDHLGESITFDIYAVGWN